jgi:hypothetical protein
MYFFSPLSFLSFSPSQTHTHTHTHTHTKIQEPVVASDGHVYEAKALQKWFEESDLSPMVGKRMGRKNVKAHTFLKVIYFIYFFIYLF